MNIDTDPRIPWYSARATQWQLPSRRLTFSREPLWMGIVNVTPDSFSDGGWFFEPELAIDRALTLVAEGADILDVGGESTRPYATPVDEAEELRRVLPVIRGIRAQTDVPISIDTSKAAIAQAALDAGADIINDVTGLTGDPVMLEVAVRTQAAVCVMHMRGTPQTMQDDPRYQDVVAEILQYLRQRRDALLEAGIQCERICLDPGIGFGKTHQHNLTLMANCWQFHQLRCPLLVGHSRKGFIGKLVGDNPTDRMHGSLGAALSLALQGIQVIRMHDVGPARAAMRLFAACGGIDEWAGQLG